MEGKYETLIIVVMVVYSGIKGRYQQVIEAVMVAMTSAMCAFFLIFFDGSCQEKGKDPNHYPLQVHIQGPDYKKILRLSYDVIITYDNRKSNLR